MKKFLFALIATAALSSASATAQNVVMCAPRQAVVADLESSGHTLTVLGITASGAAMEVHSTQTGGWVVLVTQTDGVSCTMARGTDLALITPSTGTSDAS